MKSSEVTRQNEGQWLEYEHYLPTLYGSFVPNPDCTEIKDGVETMNHKLYKISGLKQTCDLTD